jgi:hypothetical protein
MNIEEQNLNEPQNPKLGISGVIGSVDSKIDLIGKKGKELWYPTYAPHIIIGTNKSNLVTLNFFMLFPK